MTTIPVPRLMSENFWYCTSSPPERATSPLAAQSPTVVVRAGSMEEDATISRLSPVARMDSPSRVRRKRASRTAATTATIPASSSLPMGPRAASAAVKTFCSLSMFRLERPPITIRLTV